MAKRYSKKFSTHFLEKVALRKAFLPSKKELLILDAYHAKGEIWDTIIHDIPDKSFNIIGIDTHPYKKNTLKGDNRKYLTTLSLSTFDVIDLDAYGCPFDQLQILFDRQYTGRVFVTFIQTVMKILPFKLLETYGYSREMIRQCPTLFNSHGLRILKNYLAQQGIKEIAYYAVDIPHTPKYYLTFQIGKENIT